MEKKKLLKSKWLLPLVFIAIVSAVITLYVIAKYAGTADVEGEVNLQGFDVTPEITSEYTDWNSDTGVVEMTADEYEAFMLNIKKSGNGWAYIRVSVEESWRIKKNDDTEVTAITTGGILNWDTDLVINTSDNFYYVDGIVTNNPATISIISGNNTAPTDINVDAASGEELVVRLSIKVEAIQYNRLNAFWGLDPDNYPNQ